METTFDTCHFSIILINLRVGVVPISEFFSPCQYFAARKVFQLKITTSVIAAKRHTVALFDTH